MGIVLRHSKSLWAVIVSHSSNDFLSRRRGSYSMEAP